MVWWMYPESIDPFAYMLYIYDKNLEKYLSVSISIIKYGGNISSMRIC